MKLKAQLHGLKLKRRLVRRDGDTAKAEKISRELADMQSKRDELKAGWKSEKEMIDKVQAKKEAVESLRFEAEQAERSGDYGKVAEIQIWQNS
jgi:ATP-dependent Clp protease ATP-binding subunit ClpB